VFPLLESSLPIWIADPQITFFIVSEQHAGQVSHFGAENPGGGFGRTVGATLPYAATQRAAVA
jgi:hypothetical protein